MKYLFFILTLFAVVAPAYGNLRFALLGLDDSGRNLADIVQAELADELEFVERGSVGDIQQEHIVSQQFGMARLARQFSGADVFVVVDRQSMTAFETCHGFRLSYQTLAIPDDMATSTAEIKSELRKLNTAMQDFYRRRIISFAGVRNNLGWSLNSKAKLLTAQISSAVNQIPALLLEREYLIELLLEQDLSMGWQEAVSASEIIHFELNQGTEEDSVEIAVYAMDADGTVTFKLSSGELAPLWDALCKHCAQPPSQGKYSLVNEAARFASEAQSARQNGKYLQAEKLQFAAFALAQDHQKYFSFGMTANEDEPAAFPYWFSALKRLPHHPEWFFSDGGFLENVNSLIGEIHSVQYSLPEKLRMEYWHWLSANRRLWLSGGAVTQFCNAVPALYEKHDEYLLAKEHAWLELMKRQSSSQELYSVTEELFHYQAEMSPEQRQNWTKLTAERLYAVPELEILAKILECNAFLYTKECNADAAARKYEELFAMLAQASAGELSVYPLLDYSSVNAYIGLMDKVNAAFKSAMRLPQ